MAQAHLFISGFVQGVFFRARTREMAQSLGLTGWVRNLPDGRVEAVFSSHKADIEKAIDWCHNGPPEASVSGVEVKWEEPPQVRPKEGLIRPDGNGRAVPTEGEEFSSFIIKH